MPNNQIAIEEAKLAKRQAQVRKAKDAEKAQKRKLAKLKRDARTHQLCERGGELNRLLQRPDDITDEQVRQFLQDVFALPAVQGKLAAILPPDPLEELSEQSELEAQEEPEDPAPPPLFKPPDNGGENKPSSSPNPQNKPHSKKRKRKR